MVMPQVGAFLLTSAGFPSLGIASSAACALALVLMMVSRRVSSLLYSTLLKRRSRGAHTCPLPSTAHLQSGLLYDGGSYSTTAAATAPDSSRGSKAAAQPGHHEASTERKSHAH